jgi:tetratricopeptide (TPR) repeat protein
MSKFPNMDKSSWLRFAQSLVILIGAFLILYYIILPAFNLRPGSPGQDVELPSEIQSSSDLEKSLAEYTAAIDRGDGSASTYSGRGAILMQLRQFRDAIDDFTKSLEYELDADVLSSRCNAYRLTANFNSAREDCKTALNLDENNVQAHIAYAMLLVEEGQFAGAREQAEAAIELKPDSSEALFALSQVEMADGDPKAALDALSKCIEVDITDPTCYWHRGFLYSSLGQIDQAIEDMKAVLKYGDPEIHGQLMLEAGTVLRQYGVDPDQ